MAAHAEQSTRELFELSYSSLIDSPEISNILEPEIPVNVIKSLAAQSRFRAKIIRIDERSIEIKSNSLYFKLNEGVCLQEVVALEDSYSLRTLCLREDYVLMDFIFKYPKH